MFLFNIKVIIFESLKSLYLMNNNSSHTQEQTVKNTCSMKLEISIIRLTEEAGYVNFQNKEKQMFPENCFIKRRGYTRLKSGIVFH